MIENTLAPREHRLQCMEIWGGSGAVFDAVSAPGVDVWVYSRPHAGSRRGGDVHYLSGCAGGNILRVAVADVSGHGEAVSAASRALRRLMRRHINTPDQSRLTRALNRAFSGEGSSTGLFATAVLGTYWAPARAFLFVRAGHPRPLFSRANGRWSALDADHPEVTRRGEEAGLSGLPLGVIDETSYEQLAVRLERGDRVLLYSDAATEVRSPGGGELGEEGLIELLGTLPHDDVEFVPALVERIEGIAGGTALADDLTLVLLRHNASPAPPQSVTDRIRTLGRLLGVVPS